MATIFYISFSLIDLIISVVEVFASLIKTKHRAIFVKQTLAAFSGLKSCRKREKVNVYDRRSHNLDGLRHCLGIHDWSAISACDYVKNVYNEWFAENRVAVAVIYSISAAVVAFNDVTRRHCVAE